MSLKKTKHSSKIFLSSAIPRAGRGGPVPWPLYFERSHALTQTQYMYLKSHTTLVFKLIHGHHHT